MNAPASAAILRPEVELLKPGAPFAGGFFAGTLNVNGQLSVLIVAPKATGDIEGAWNDSYNLVSGAFSYCDGRANTLAMAEAGSELAKAVLALDIDGFADWHIPAQDELELMYRNLKPSDYENSLYGRSGVNASATPATYAYTPESPTQTQADAFRAGGAQAFEEAWYWSSTQHADDPGCAWMQSFSDGFQYSGLKSNRNRARAVRRLVIQ
jgi:hypothetical protein